MNENGNGPRSNKLSQEHPVRLFWREWTLAKIGYAPEQNEDACLASEFQHDDGSVASLIAISDGASETVYSGLWARKLVDAAEPNWPALSDDELNQRFEEVRQGIFAHRVREPDTVHKNVRPQQVSVSRKPGDPARANGDGLNRLGLALSCVLSRLATVVCFYSERTARCALSPYVLQTISVSSLDLCRVVLKTGSTAGVGTTRWNPATSCWYVQMRWVSGHCNAWNLILVEPA